MAKRNTSPFLAIEQRIAARDANSILDRWRYGRGLVAVKAGRKQLPHGMAADLIRDARKAGLKLSDAEIRYRIQFAEAYSTEAEVVTAVTTFRSWTDLRDAGFPPVESTEPEDLEAAGIPTAAPDAFEQLSLIPGFAATLTVGGRKVPLQRATVADVKAYEDMYRQIHENYGKRLALIEAARELMVAGSGGDDTANAVEAWHRGLDAASSDPTTTEE